MLNTLSKVVLHRRSSSVKGRLRSMIVFHQRLPSVKGRLPSKVVLRQRSSSIKGRLPSKAVFRQFNLIWLSRVWQSSAQPSIICIFELVNLNNLHYLSLQAGPPQWPPLRSTGQRCFQRGHCKRVPKIANFGRREGRSTKKRGRILPGL